MLSIMNLFNEIEEMIIIFLDPSIIKKIKSTETEPPHNEVKGEGLISCM
jgi:hypothetical protein